MNRTYARLLLAIACPLLVRCATPSQPFEGHPVLKKIEIEGNKTIDGNDLLAKIATSPTTGFFTKTPHYYDADLFAIDLQRIVRWYNQKGFYEAKILDLNEEKDDEGRIILHVKLEEGRRAYIKQMVYDGLEDLPRGERSDIDDALPIHPGDGFDEDGYEKAKEVLESQLKEHGFAEAAVTGEVKVAPDDGAANIVFHCEKGKRFKFGKVLVTGNRRISVDEIAQATGIHKGDSYSPSAIELAQQRVYNLGAFSGVRLGLEPLGDAAIAAVRVSVHEAPFQTVRFGLGFSIEETRWELPRLRAEYTNRSLLGGLRRLELASTVGYAFVASPFDYHPDHSGITTLTSAQLVIPNVLLPGLDWVNRVEFAREVQGAYDYNEVAARISLLYRRGRHTVSPSLNFVRYFKVNLQGNELFTVISKAGNGAGIFQDCPHACTLTYPEIRYTYDGRDNAIEPSQGYFGTVSLQQTLKPGSFSYFRLDPELRVYTPFTKYMVLAGRARYGGMIPEAGRETPFTQRFFGGGQIDQRGYSPLRQGPKIGAQQSCKPGDAGCVPYAQVAVPVGGTAQLLLSAEVRLHADYLLNHLGIVAFLDASQVGTDYKNPATDRGLELAPGLGLRYITPFGPLRLDLAWLANPKDVTTPAVTVLDDAGKEVTLLNPTRVGVHCDKSDTTCIHEARFAFHLTLGEAF